MLIVEVNDLKILENPHVDGFLIGTDYLSSETYKKYELATVKKVIEDAHKQAKKVFLDATNIFHDQDLPKVKEILEELNNVDYIMYNDLALLKYIPIAKRMYYSTTYVTNQLDFDIIQAENTFVLVSPELSFEELKKFKTKTNAFLIGFGTWEIFHSRRRLLSNYFKYRQKTYAEAKYHIIEEFRNEQYPIVEDNGTKIYLNGYYYLGKELKELGHHLIIKSFDLELEIIEKLLEIYQKALDYKAFEEIEKQIKELPIEAHKGLLYEQSVLTKGVSERG